MRLQPFLLLLTVWLAGCDGSTIPGLGPDPKIAQKEADSKAIGGACRYGLRSIEDCYTLNPKATKAHVFTGWKDMDQYMRDNKIEGEASTLKTEEETGASAPTPAASEKPTEKASEPKAKTKAKTATASH